MKDYLANEIRNVCLLGHSSSGKTTLAQASLFYTKATDRLESGILNYDAEEIRKKTTIFTSIAPVEWKNCKINFIDTPGYLDYEGEMASGLAISDNALIVLNGKEGVENGTIKAYQEVKKRKIPTIFFVNKMDEENASFIRSLNQLRENFGKNVIAFELPIIDKDRVIGSVNILRGKAWYYDDGINYKEIPFEMKEDVEIYYNQIAEAIAMTDDVLMEKFFNGEKFSEQEIAKGLRIGVRNGDIIPVYCGSAIKVSGVHRVLDLISEYFPSYAEKGLIKVKENEEEILLSTSENEKFSALIFKTIIDPFVGKISFIKITSGILTSDSIIYNSTKKELEKINQIFIAKGKNQIAVGKLFTGDIGILVKLQYSETNDTLTEKEYNIELEKINFPKALLAFAIYPKSKNDEDKLSNAINKLLEEDKTLRFVNNVETHQQLVYCTGEQSFDVFINKLKNKYKVEVGVDDVKVQYRETITIKVDAEGKHKKQSGGAGQYGHVKIKFEPSESEEMIFEEEIFGGSVPKQYFPAVEQGLLECMECGVLAGYKVVGVKATLYDGSYHEVDSKEIAFKAAARLAYKDGIPKAKPILLEPIGKATIIVPEEYTGTIFGDINKKRGVILGVEPFDEKMQKIIAEVPISEMLKYAIEIRSITHGKGNYDIEFDRYEPAPIYIVESIIKNHKHQ